MALLESRICSSDFYRLRLCSPRFLLHVQRNRAALEEYFSLPRSIRYQPWGLFSIAAYRCPNTGFRVQGWVQEDESEDGETYEGVICHACGRLHLVNPKTGETAGGADK